ncbi:MAG: DUF1987 domain-containing protein [Cytophagales bacterium]|nr:MAG: DUF1987 domain-containing protein [Cytophagales bacterium]
MENIFIKETDTTPEISFNYQRGILEIKGVSIPEDTEDFYEPLLKYLNNYIQNPKSKTTIVSFKLIYINTSTSAIMARIIKVLEKLHSAKHSVNAKWYFEEGDDDMKEIGSDFRAFTTVPFTLVPCEEIL